MKIYKCSKCNFVTIEDNKVCPLCSSLVNIIEEETKNYSYADPEYINQEKKDTEFSYYCYKCKNYSAKKVCMNCNIVGYLTISYKGKRYILNRISDLSEVYSKYEVDAILDDTSQHEKDYIYHNLDNNARFFYRVDKAKSSTAFFIGALLFILGFIISTSSFDKELIITYVANAFGNAMFSIFLFLGIWYLKNAYEVEEFKAPTFLGINALIIASIYVITATILRLTFVNGFLVGIIFLIINLVINYIYYRKMKNKI